MSPEGPSAAHILADEIDSEGAIPLSRYMAIANAAYYADRDPLGIDGDFTTAPEISQMFGEMIGVWLADLWMRKGSAGDCHFVELGPGRGTLAADARRTMARFKCQPDVHFVETSPLLKARQAELHGDAIWHDSVASLPTDGPLLIIANEFFDALPIEQFITSEAGWRRMMVARDRSKFIPVPGNSPEAGSDTAMAHDFPDGTILETSPASSEIVSALSARLARQGGVMLIIDYGYDRPGTGSTLQAVKNHLPVSPFDDPGASDLTAHVNFHSLANIAKTRMLPVHGPAEQGQWLKAIGIDHRADMLVDSAAPEQEQDIRAAHHRLTHVDEMGRLFRVMAIRALDWPEPDGFVYEDSAA